MFRWLRSLFTPLRPAGPPVTLRRFSVRDSTLTGDGIRVDGEEWVVASPVLPTVRLFEVDDPGVEQCLLTYRASVKTDSLDGRAFLEMWCRIPGRGEFFSKGLHHAVAGTTDWTSLETPFYLKRGQRPDQIKLNVVVETKGKGEVRIRDLELLKTPLA